MARQTNIRAQYSGKIRQAEKDRHRIRRENAQKKDRRRAAAR